MDISTWIVSWMKMGFGVCIMLVTIAAIFGLMVALILPVSRFFERLAEKRKPMRVMKRSMRLIGKKW